MKPPPANNQSNPLWGFDDRDGSLGVPPPSKDQQWNDDLFRLFRTVLPQRDKDGVILRQRPADTGYRIEDGLLVANKPGDTYWQEQDGVLTKRSVPSVSSSDTVQLSGPPWELGVSADQSADAMGQPQLALTSPQGAIDYNELEKQLYPDGVVPFGWRQQAQEFMRGDEGEAQRQADLGAIIEQGEAERQAEAMQPSVLSQMAQDTAFASQALERAPRLPVGFQGPGSPSWQQSIARWRKGLLGASQAITGRMPMGGR